MCIDPFLSSCTKLNSKWLKDLHIKPDTLKLIEMKLGRGVKEVVEAEKNTEREKSREAEASHDYEERRERGGEPKRE